MTASDTWASTVREAAEQLGHPIPAIPRTVAGIAAALRVEGRGEFRTELDGLGDGLAFEATLDAWWTQAVVDAQPDQGAKERALEVADLAVSLHNKAGSATASAAPPTRTTNWGWGPTDTPSLKRMGFARLFARLNADAIRPLLHTLMHLPNSAARASQVSESCAARARTSITAAPISKLGTTGIRRVCIGPYRATYEIDGDRIAIKVLMVGSVQI